uniref:uncharacterized protein LOC122583149 n=1 Tax=Erigeron canadensis TaxID=72917 RepID=UPI001CB8A5C1|nr:uncharacterized protein LOC122583149 [Erigeron canadensis]
MDWKHIWDTWHLRGLIIFSLLLQTSLIFIAPFRKRTSSKWIITLLWLFYLFADLVSTFALGLITKGQGNRGCLSGKEDNDETAVEKHLLVFWAPFLLLHLGGPDTITAFALEDNELWLRHAFGLAFQFVATIIVFVRSFPNGKIWVPTVLMIMNGTIKYSERTVAFYLASKKKFKSSMLANVDPGMNYVGLMEDNHSIEEVQLNNTITERYLTNTEVLHYANEYFKMFKGLVVDLVFTRTTTNASQKFFQSLTGKDAFKVVEVELNLFYEALFTKLPVVLYGYYGLITRVVSVVMVIIAIILFDMNKSKLSKTDVTITYSLLYGAMALDIAALLMLLNSNKTIISLYKLSMPGNKCTTTRNVSAFLIRKINGNHRNPNIEAQTETSKLHRGGWLFMLLKRRWSNSIPAYNLIHYCLHPRWRLMQFIYEKLGVCDFMDSFKYVKPKRFTMELGDFIFKELKKKSRLAVDLETAMEISSSRGDRVLRFEEGWRDLLPYTIDGDFGQRILLWHIATDLCYSKDLDDEVKSKRHVYTNMDYREIAKLLSDYMMYLLIMKPSMMTTVTSIVQIQFWDLCANAKSFFKNERSHNVQKQMQGSRNADVDWENVNACMKIFDQNEKRVTDMRGDVTNTLLVYSFLLAKEVMKIEEDMSLDKWLMISQVWVELLCYGASHSHAKMQAAQLSQGGDLITIVWLLMAHFGLGEQFQIDEHQERARRFVD